MGDTAGIGILSRARPHSYCGCAHPVCHSEERASSFPPLRAGAQQSEIKTGVWRRLEVLCLNSGEKEDKERFEDSDFTLRHLSTSNLTWETSHHLLNYIESCLCRKDSALRHPRVVYSLTTGNKEMFGCVSCGKQEIWASLERERKKLLPKIFTLL